jgi:hypothetical protein
VSQPDVRHIELVRVCVVVEPVQAHNRIPVVKEVEYGLERDITNNWRHVRKVGHVHGHFGHYLLIGTWSIMQMSIFIFWQGVAHRS